MREASWAVVVPVKRLGAAKTRLRGALPGVPHETLVLAMAQDTVRAARACPMVAEVLVVTDDPAAAAALGALGARVVPDAPAAGLNPAVGYGAALLTGAPGTPAPAGPPRPGETFPPGPPPVPRPVAALSADLPALRPRELAGALRAAADGGDRCGFVADAAGTGTTLLAAPGGVTLDPRFGPDSAARHAAAGAHRLDGDWPALRRDVDTAADLAEARRLGLGPHTSRL